MKEKITEADEMILKQKYGEPLLFRNGKAVRLNEQYFAGYIAMHYHVAYYSSERTFYRYIKEKGIWVRRSDEQMLELIGLWLHQYAVEYNEEVDNLRSKSFFTAVMKLLQGQIEDKNIFSKNDRLFVHCRNCILEWNTATNNWEQKDFSPDYYSRNQNPIEYVPEKTCPGFLEQLLESAMTEDDIRILKLYIGQCLLGTNQSQTFLLLIGTPGGGKSTLVNVIEGLIGRWNCTELRLEHMTGRFEVSRTSGKTLLTGKDVSSDFLSGPGSRQLKVLTGNDTMTAEFKNKNTRIDITGNFNVIITSNNILRINFDGDIDAWRRRILIISYNNPAPKKVIVDFDRKLLDEEGSGILNWALEGAEELLKTNGKIDKKAEQLKRIDILLKSSQPFEVFGNHFIHPTPNASITTEEVVALFTKFCRKMNWPDIPERKAQQLFHAHMQAKYGATKRGDIKRNGTSKRGYGGYQICKNNMENKRPKRP